MTELEKRLTDALSELSEQYERERDEKTGVPLRQRIDSVDRLEFAGVCPGCSQFILVQSRPLCDKAQRLRGSRPAKVASVSILMRASVPAYSA